MRQWWIKHREQVTAYLFILPFFAFFAVFMLCALFEGVLTSMQHQTFRAVRFVWLDNYVKLFSDPVFLQATFNTVAYVAVIVTATLVLAVWIAGTVFDASLRLIGFVRVAYYIPTIASMVVMSIIWYCLLNPTSGVVPYALSLLGVGNVNLLSDPDLVFWTVCFVVVFTNIGTAIILYLSAMMGVPMEILEAADIDGATRLQKLRYVLLPSVQGTTGYLMVTNIVAVLKIFAIIKLLTAGGPNYRTTSMMYYLYTNAFQFNKIGLASASGVILFLLAALISVPRMMKLLRDM